MRAIAGALFTLLLIVPTGCDSPQDADPEVGDNPFLEDSIDKADTGYINPGAVEVHLTIEGDAEAPAEKIFGAPAELTLFAFTSLRRQAELLVEILADDATAHRVEWLVDGEWLNHARALSVDRSRLRHWRITDVNAIIYRKLDVQPGDVYHGAAPYNPYTVLDEAGDGCAKPEDDIHLSNHIYWYVWDPRRSNCSIPTQDLAYTITEVLPHNPESYPEFDQLLEDGRLTAVVLFGRIDHGGAVEDDTGWRDVRKLSGWLLEAGFAEQENPPLGRRFVKQAGELEEIVDIYGPDVFENVADYARFSNWQKAVSEHEIVIYSGHSVLGSGMAFERVSYPDFYQIFQLTACLSYEYYVNPVLEGKGDWALVDVVSNIQPTSYAEALPVVSVVLSKLLWGAEHQGHLSWQDIMEAVSRRVTHSRFGVSGARTNCFSPAGDRCEGEPPPDPDELRFESQTTVDIPDEDLVTITILVDESADILELRLEIDLTHSFVGDLEIVLEHDGVTHLVWDQIGSTDNNIDAVFPISTFYGMDTAGGWELTVTDNFAGDVGTLNRWALVVKPR